MNNVNNVVSALKKLSIEKITYSIITLAGLVFIGKRLFGKKKVNKRFYNKQKKRVSIRLGMLFFTGFKGELDIIRKPVQCDESELNRSMKKMKIMKKFAEKIVQEK